MKSKVKWLSAVTVCDVCQSKFGSHFYDAKTMDGPWGLLCESCFKKIGIGVGPGMGQKYCTKSKLKVEG